MPIDASQTITTANKNTIRGPAPPTLMSAQDKNPLILKNSNTSINMITWDQDLTALIRYNTNSTLSIISIKSITPPQKAIAIIMIIAKIKIDMVYPAFTIDQVLLRWQRSIFIKLNRITL